MANARESKECVDYNARETSFLSMDENRLLADVPKVSQSNISSHHPNFYIILTIITRSHVIRKTEVRKNITAETSIKSYSCSVRDSLIIDCLTEDKTLN
jgi:hypothetical protein